MEKLDELVSPPNSPVPLTVSRRPLARFARNWDFLAVLLLIGFSIPLAWISPSALVVVQHPGTFDDHWVLDTIFKASRGIWFGRDVAFSYGPLFQWLFSAPARWAGLSMGSIYTAARTFVLWLTYLFGFLTLRLLLPRQAAWKRFLLLILLSVFWVPWDGRTAFDIFLFALFLRGWYAIRDERLQAVMFGCGAALFCAAAFLYSADTGVFGVAVLLVSLAGVAWEGRREAQKVRMYALAIAAFAVSSVVLILLLNAAMASLLDFGFWRRSLALVTEYRWDEPASMSQNSAIRLLVLFIIGAVVYVVHWRGAGDRTAVTARPGFLLSAFAFSVLAMQTGLVRSDPNHIVFAVFPMVFLTGTVLFSFRSRLVSLAAAVIAVACSVLFSQPAPTFQSSSLRYRYVQFRYPVTTCPAGFGEFDHACYPARFTTMLETAANYLQGRSAASSSVVIFPYQYMFGMAAGRNVAGAVELSLLAVSPYLAHLDIASLQRAAAPVGLYFPDGSLSLPIDGVPNFTRNSGIWIWMFQHYRGEQELAPDVLGLQRDDSRAARISMHPLALGLPAQAHPIRERSTTMDLGPSYWPTGADFLRLRMTVHYGPLWKLRKPERLQLEITRADGSYDLKAFVVEPNVSSEVWFYPWNEPDLAHYFGADEMQWRTTKRSAITRLRLLVTPVDWVSQQPDSIMIESADAVTVSMAHQ